MIISESVKWILFIVILAILAIFVFVLFQSIFPETGIGYLR